MPTNSTPPVALPSPDHPSAFDLSGLGQVPIIPLVPEEVLKQHHVFIPTDLRFRAAARLLQGLWREDRDLPLGTYVDAEDKRTRLGSRITEAAGRAGGNFLTPDIAQVVRRELIYREIGAMIDEDRLKTNLLSSMPLCFNLFVPLKLDLRAADRFVAELFPNLISEVTHIYFESSPGRGNPRFTADYSAFDVVILGLSDTGKRVFIAIEVKYSEAGFEPMPTRIHPRHLDLVASSGIFAEPEDPALFTNPLQQLVREHNLAQSILDAGLAEHGVFLLIGPAFNHLATGMAETYAKGLNPPVPHRVAFVHITLERIIEGIAAAGLVDHARALHRRYCDWHLVDGEIELALAAEAPTRRRNSRSQDAAPQEASISSEAA